MWHARGGGNAGVGAMSMGPQGVPSGADCGMEFSEEGHHAAPVPRGSLRHPASKVFQSLGSQNVPAIQLAAPHPFQEGPI